METKILDGLKISKIIKQEVREKIEFNKIMPTLAVILVGSNDASAIYVKNKKKDCEECGIKSIEYHLPESAGQYKLLSLIDELNKNKEINGILCQLPLPKGHDYIEAEVLERIAPEKDVDAFNPHNVGNIVTGSYLFAPCTPSGIMGLLEEYDIDFHGKKCVIVNRSNIVGKPLAMLMLRRNATVTICHSATRDLFKETRDADILVTAIGKANYFNKEHIKEGAVVVDVSMNRNEDGKLCGDVCYNDVLGHVSYITPVPGGVGPMTRAMLMKNTLTAYFCQNII